MKRNQRKFIRNRTEELRRSIAAMDFVTSGTLLTRTKVCGRPNCRCAEDVNARHGPYYEWTRRSEGRLLHHVISADQANLVKHAIQNHRAIERLLDQWEAETVVAILTPERDT
jgi:hypothetical protein